jgi:hypothetical protein
MGGSGGAKPTGGRRLSAQDVSEIKRCTRDAETLRWPAGVRDEQGD